MDLAEMINLEIYEEDDDVDVLEFLENGIPRQIYERNNYFDTLDEVAFRRRFFDVICLVVGDSGYANTNFLLTPLLRPRTPAEQLYNESHIRTNVVERCFGVLKRRFPILANGCRLQSNKVLIIIVATSVLHLKK
jgi:hypothetical protein